LLLVGKSYLRKGVDVAIETVRLLNLQGIPAELTVCGVDRQDDKFVKFVGILKKNVTKQLEQYLDLYRHAHFLIHPSLFETAGIVPSEAAAFGTPTITNATGGLATTVADGVSGVVLPKGSLPQAYVDAISSLVHNPDRYYALCKSTRLRYERELNWDAVGRRFSDAFHQIVETDTFKKHQDKSTNNSRS
jgi:glycosyltransferase involved in cell wall biosynthesis